MRAIWSVNLNPNRLDPDLGIANLTDAAGAAFAQLAELGAGGVRVDLFWRWLMPEAGRVNVEAVAWYRWFFTECRARGLAVYTLLYHPPDWAMARDEAGFLAAWEDFCKLVAREFGDSFDLVQVWNEPNNFLAPLKADPALFHERKLGKLTLPTGVRWETLAALFAIARGTLPVGTPLVFNVLTNLSPFLPFKGTWLDWEAFTDRFLALAGEYVDVIALDHYPDTWAPGTGPLEWECLEIAAKKAADPASSWYGKSVILGETGYSDAPNFALIQRPIPVLRFYPADRCETSMASWYGAAMTHVAGTLTRDRFPHNTSSWINLYELFDAPRPVGEHPLLKIEDHFGLVRRDGTPKAAFGVMQAIMRGEEAPVAPPVPARLPAYWHLAQLGQRLQARLAPQTLMGEPLVLERTVPQASSAVPSPRSNRASSSAVSKLK